MNTLFAKLIGLIVLIVLLNAPSQAIAVAKWSMDPPLWVKMMEDPNTNYYRAIEEYNLFWKSHEKPTDEEELKNKQIVPQKGKHEIEEEATTSIDDYYRYQCKRFEHWMRVNKPYVQKDGHILTAEERVKIWEQTQKGK